MIKMNNNNLKNKKWIKEIFFLFISLFIVLLFNLILNADVNSKEEINSRKNKITDKDKLISDLLTISKWEKKDLLIYLKDKNLMNYVISALNDWNEIIGNIFTFYFTEEINKADIIIGIKNSGMKSFCGKTILRTKNKYEDYDSGYNSRGNYSDASKVYRVNTIHNVIIYINASCPDYKKTMKHEIGHALGIVAHIEDGGIMSKNGGNGEFTDNVKSTIKAMYLIDDISVLNDVFLIMQKYEKKGKNK